MIDFNKVREENRRRALEAREAGEFASSQPKEPSPDALDHTPLNFGKYRGMSPSDVAQTKEGAEWIRWAYANVKNRKVCSELLATDCGWVAPLSAAKAEAIRTNISKAPTGIAANADYEDDDIPF